MEETVKNKKSGKKNILKVAGLILGLVIIFFMIREVVNNWEAISPYLANMNVPVFLLSVCIYAAAFLLTGYNWTYLLWKMEKGPGRREYLNAHMVSALARYIPGGIWSIVGKAYFCNQQGVSAQATSVSIILEYVFQIASSGLFFVVLLPFILKTGMQEWMAAAIVVLMIVILIILPFCINLGIRILSAILKKDCGNIKLKRSFVYEILARYAGAWIVTGIGLIALVSAFSKVDFLQAVVLVLSYPVSWVVGFLSPSPNGMGIREAILRILLGDSQAHELVLLIVVTTRLWTILGEIVAFTGFKLYYFLTGRKIKDAKLSEK